MLYFRRRSSSGVILVGPPGPGWARASPYVLSMEMSSALSHGAGRIGYSIAGYSHIPQTGYNLLMCPRHLPSPSRLPGKEDHLDHVQSSITVVVWL